VAVSTVSESERLLFRKLHYPGIYRCVARYGYRDRVHMDTKFVIKLLDKVHQHCWSLVAFLACNINGCLVMCNTSWNLIK